MVSNVLTRKLRNLYLACFTVSITGFISGAMLTWTSPVLVKLNSTDYSENPLGRQVTSQEISWIGSLSSIGAIIGPFMYGFIVGKLGRRICTLTACVPYLAAYLLAAFGDNVWYFYASRVLAGIGLGGSYIIMPVYIGEVAENHNRGILVSLASVLLTGGILFSYCLGPYTSLMVFNIVSSLFPLACILIAIVWLPESPYFLIQKKRTTDALKVLRVLRDSNGREVDKEFKEMKENVSKVTEAGGAFDMFRTKAATKAFLISLTLVIMQQLCGGTVLLSYTQNIFEEAGTTLPSAIASIIVGVAEFVTVYLTPLGVERFGRKTLLMFSSCGIALILSLIGSYFYMDENDYELGSVRWLPILCFVIFIVFYNSGISALPWTVVGELFPLNVKAAGTSICTSVHWTTGFLVNFYFYSLVSVIGKSGAFWMFGGFMVVCFVFISLCVIETKGKSLQEILDILAE